MIHRRVTRPHKKGRSGDLRISDQEPHRRPGQALGGAIRRNPRREGPAGVRGAAHDGGGLGGGRQGRKPPPRWWRWVTSARTVTKGGRNRAVVRFAPHTPHIGHGPYCHACIGRPASCDLDHIFDVFNLTAQRQGRALETVLNDQKLSAPGAVRTCALLAGTCTPPDTRVSLIPISFQDAEEVAMI
jgi:hypothetical protein